MQAKINVFTLGAGDVAGRIPNKASRSISYFKRLAQRVRQAVK